MGRMTRAKATEIAETMHIDEDAVLDLPSDAQENTKPSVSEAEERPALSELAPNSTSSKQSEDAQAEQQKPAKGKKGGKKGTKGSKKDATGLGMSTSVLADAPPLEVIPDEVESVPSPASKAASDDLVKDLLELEMSHLPVQDIRPSTPPSNAVCLTRSQLSKAPEDPEPKSLAEDKQTIADAPVPLNAEDMPNYLQACDDSPMTPTKRQRNASPSSHVDPDDMTSDGPSTYDQLEAAAVEAQTPPKTTAKDRSSRDSITAIDNLDDAVEKINAEIPEVQTSPEKPKSKKSAPVVRTTKASQARISLAHGPKDAAKPPSWGRPRPSAVGLNQSTAKRITSTASTDSIGNAGDQMTIQKKETVIPHSKPRPVSMSFPTPPPPPKSTKAPTQSTFQLPGEAIAAKLKAAKEARLAKEAEDLQKKKSFKARPAPSSTKTPSVRQTSTSKARESLMIGKPLASTSGGVHKRANSVATTRPSTGPRTSTVRPSTTTRPTPAAKKSTTPSQSTSISKRPSTAMASLTKPHSRPSTANKPARPSSVIIRPASTALGAKPNGTTKGKEVFNRTAQAKSTAEKAKREKEEAAKKARLEAAERGRLASREWAEKQRLRKLGLKPETKSKENVEPEVVEA